MTIRRTGGWWTAVLVLLLVPLGCGGGPKEAPRGKVVILGLDGAEWDLIHPMVAAGELPNLARLMNEGVYGKLRSLEPLAKSPAIWTTIATGKSPEEHGIRTFIDRKNGKPLTRNIRKVRALWNILSGLDRSVGVVGWLMSWPAEKVNGFVVTDYLQYGPGRSTRFQHRTYPEALEQDVAPLVTPWRDLPWSYVQRFFDQPMDTSSFSPNLESHLRPVRMYTAADLTFSRIGRKLYRERHPDFFALYLRGTDTMGHLYWNYMIPEQVPARLIDSETASYVHGAVRAYYRFVDEEVGALLAEVDQGTTTVIVCSDHGFKGGTGRGVKAHKVDGVLIMAGRGVGKGEITGATVYDIAPTVLVLMGLPPAQDMPGKVLWVALDEEIPRERFRATIPTYETGDGGEGGNPEESPVDEEIKERLRSLGYID